MTPAAQDTGSVKLWEVMGEAYGQTTLQSYIIAQIMYVIEHGTRIVKSWQWITLAISLCSLSSGITTAVPTLGYGAGEVNVSSQVAWFLCGLLAVVTRVLVGGHVFSMYSLQED